MRWPCIYGFAAASGIRLRLQNRTEISAAICTLDAREGLFFYFLQLKIAQKSFKVTQYRRRLSISIDHMQFPSIAYYVN